MKPASVVNTNMRMCLYTAVVIKRVGVLLINTCCRCLVDQACTSPCEPQPLRLTAPSGLSRAQFLVATRAVRLPIFPGYCSEHGGTVCNSNSSHVASSSSGNVVM
jgi:hypothetical protein